MMSSIERDIHSSFYVIIFDALNKKSTRIYVHYYGNGIFLIPIKCVNEGNYKLTLYFGDEKIYSTKFKANNKNYCNVQIYCNS